MTIRQGKRKNGKKELAVETKELHEDYDMPLTLDSGVAADLQVTTRKNKTEIQKEKRPIHKNLC